MTSLNDDDMKIELLRICHGEIHAAKEAFDWIKYAEGAQWTPEQLAAIDSQIASNARTGNEPLSGTEAISTRHATDVTFLARDYKEGTVIDFGEMGKQIVRNGRWERIPEADVIGCNGDAGLAARLGIRATGGSGDPLSFDDYKPASEQ